MHPTLNAAFGHEGDEPIARYSQSFKSQLDNEQMPGGLRAGYRGRQLQVLEQRLKSFDVSPHQHLSHGLLPFEVLKLS
jgi:hypothetical protein